MILTSNPALNHVLLANRRFYADFSVYPGGLMPVVGTLAVSGGALQAATAGNWLGQLVANPEATIDTAGWTPSSTTIDRVDSEIDPGLNSGATDKWAFKVTKTDTLSDRFVLCNVNATIGATYVMRARIYSPSGNTEVEAGWIVFSSGRGWAAPTVYGVGNPENAWIARAITNIASSATPQGEIRVRGTTAGDIAYFDGITIYRQNTPALVAGWPTPNFIATLDHISPAAGVVPFSKVIRYENPLNYWEVRVLPNTAGDDLQIMQVTAGVGTPRAAADVDWTSNGLDQLRVVAEGSVIGTEHKKSGAGSWTDGASWATATQGQGAPGIGPMFWGTGVGRLDTLEVVAR